MDKRIQANLRVKESITNALFFLMQEKTLSEITVTEIIDRAKVARASFYRNYRSKLDVITVFISDILERFRNGREMTSINYRSHQYVKKVLIYFRTYAQYLVDLYNANLISLVIDGVNAFQAALEGDALVSPYKKYSVSIYGGALFNMALEWARGGCTEPVEDMVDIFCREMKIEQ